MTRVICVPLVKKEFEAVKKESREKLDISKAKLASVSPEMRDDFRRREAVRIEGIVVLLVETLI